MIRALLFPLALAAALAAPVSARSAPICTPRDDGDTLLLAEILRESVLARAPADTAAALDILQLGTLRCSDHLGVVQALAQNAGRLRSDLGRQVAIAAWLHLQDLRPDSHLNPSYQARVVHLVARRTPLDLALLAAQVYRFEERYGPGSGWQEALAADEALQVAHQAHRREVFQVAASAAHARARETGAPEDWAQVLAWTLRLGGDGQDPAATRAWALAAWESGDHAAAQAALQAQALAQPDQALAATGTLATLHWNDRVVTRGRLGAPPQAALPESVLVLEGGHLRPRFPLAPEDAALLQATDAYLALGPGPDALPDPAALALAGAVVTVTHGHLTETRARLVALVETWPESPQAVDAVSALARIGDTYAHAARRDRPSDLCVDHAAVSAWADGPGADAQADALGAVAAWRAPRCRGGVAD